MHIADFLLVKFKEKINKKVMKRNWLSICTLAQSRQTKSEFFFIFYLFLSSLQLFLPTIPPEKS